jgi:hypothetical protein
MAPSDCRAGAIYNAPNSTANITGSTFSGNSALWGGAIYNYGFLGIINSTFSGNTATQEGGAIYNSIELNILNSTFSGNAAPLGGAGIWNDGGNLLFSNTIIANSTAGCECANYGQISFNKNNLVEDMSCGADYSGDPSLGPLADNGGPTLTHALLPGSSAIDLGDSSLCQLFDQRGVKRPQGAGCDIGAYEYEYSLIFLPLLLKQ